MSQDLPVKLDRWKPAPPQETEPITLALTQTTLKQVRRLAAKHKLTPEAFLSQYVEWVARPSRGAQE